MIKSKKLNVIAYGITIFVICMTTGSARAQHLQWMQGGGSIGPMSSSVGPSVAVFNNRLFAAWKGYKDDQNIYWSSIDAQKPPTPYGGTWAPQQRIPNVSSSVGPALAVFNGKLFAAWKGYKDDQAIYWSSFDGANWAPQQRIPNVSSSVGPALAVFNKKLFAAWKGYKNDEGIYWSTFDGTSWAPQQRIPGVGSSNGPALVSAFGGLLAAWKGIQGDPGIYYASFDGRAWSAQKNIHGAKTSGKPSLTMFNRVYAVWKGDNGDDTLYSSAYNGGPDWGGQVAVAGARTATGGAITAFGMNVYVVWRGAGDDQSLQYLGAFEVQP